MKYIAFLRGINVGGNTIVSMAKLKMTFESCGFKNVRTFINSGNVIFESAETSQAKLISHIEAAIEKDFAFPVRIALFTKEALLKILDECPLQDAKEGEYRTYLSFVLPPISTQEVVETVKLKEGIDFMTAGKNVVYMSTKMSGLTKSGFTKMIGTPIYKSLTMRNVTTVKKIVALLKSK